VWKVIYSLTDIVKIKGEWSQGWISEDQNLLFTEDQHYYKNWQKVKSPFREDWNYFHFGSSD
jgi:hypothetical protein